MFDFTKILFTLQVDEAEQWPPVGFESVWGIPRTTGAYMVDNVPYYIYGVSKADIISAHRDGDQWCADAVMERGGHSTLRVFADYGSDAWLEMIERLSGLGAVCGAFKGLSLFTVDVPETVDFQAIDAYLASVADGDDVFYEDACLQHAGISEDRRRQCDSLATVPLKLH